MTHTPTPPDPRHDHHAENAPPDYLWDKSGPPDPEIARLEQLLAPFAHGDRAAPDLAANPLKFRPAPASRWKRFALAAAIVLAGVVALIVFRSSRPTPTPTSWTIARITGKVEVGDLERLKIGQDQFARTLTTGADARVTITAPGGATIHVEPETRVQLLDITPGVPSLQLAQGRIYTEAWASATPSSGQSIAPCEIITPAGVAVVSPDTSALFEFGANALGRVEIKVGGIEFRDGTRVTRMLGLTTTLLSERVGVGTPYASDAPGAYRKVLAILDEHLSEKSPTKGRAPLLQELLRDSRPADAVTLWNLLWRVSPAERDDVLTRLVALLPMKGAPRIEREGQIDEAAMDALWKTIRASR